MLRYSNRSIYGIMETTPYFILTNTQNVSSSLVEVFFQQLGKLLESLRSQAASAGPLRKFAFGNTSAGGLQNIYALTQCTPDLSEQECSDCFGGPFGGAFKEFASCCSGKIGGRYIRPSCNFGYESYPFIDPANVVALPSPIFLPQPSTNTNPTGSKGNKSRTVIIVVVSMGALMALIISIFIYLRARKTKKMLETKFVPGEDVDEIHNSEALQFDFDTIRGATYNFSEANKLGEGGFGFVYKGTLNNGQEIAVKRLSKSSGQGVREFKNEVLLVAKLQHRNLVRLLEFCLEGEEIILVYEYVPNKSLDYFLFETKKREQLDWSSRCTIIGGIARGILYLHEDSRLRVIHRDLKASNILLDANMNPKISDFGMAKMFGVDDQTQGNTRRIVGTYGYMAPEYAMEGLYSVKSDVFSFGILLLEIITGRKNFLGSHPTTSALTLLSYAWELWNEGKVLELMDPLLKDSCSPNELLRYIHIGLLCVQEDANNRPTMSSVVHMLKSESISLSKPERPAFYTGRRSTNDHGNAFGAPISCSVNDLTISDHVPR